MTNNQLSELLINMEGLIFRVASIVVRYSPAAQQDMQAVFTEWNNIAKDILKE